MKAYNSVLSAVVVSVLGLSAMLNAPQALSQSPTSTAESNEPSLPAKPGAVEISIVGIGPLVDTRAVNKVRRTVGASIAMGVTDTYFVRGYGREGGFSACAQKSPLRVNGFRRIRGSAQGNHSGSDHDLLLCRANRELRRAGVLHHGRQDMSRRFCGVAGTTYL